MIINVLHALAIKIVALLVQESTQIKHQIVFVRTLFMKILIKFVNNVY